ncbi:carboxy-S-adenosyl-L-methionine synthase CmoA [Streptomyces sp. NPDC048521]|uniref:carboxy-S-adenosyl-L-methionine synthase CmoA n=1 Tax=Streptomyces sp. NPDC048521 TaxID=3365566 RepID=UPI003711C4D8
MTQDTIYQGTYEASDFAFGTHVAGVFDDMVQRSVPGYLMLQDYMCRLLETLPEPPRTILDIGCATGTSMALLSKRFPGVQLIGYDDSSAMLAKAEQNLSKFADNGTSFEFRQEDVCEVEAFPEADAVVLNLTLQFIRPTRRLDLLRQLAAAIRPGGALILAEKVLEADSGFTRRLISAHHEFKREQGYSDLEIARKREDIENVLVPFTVSENEELLRAAGFEQVGLALKCLNFALLAGFRAEVPGGGDSTC